MLRVLLATNRPSVRVFFEEQRQGPAPLSLLWIPLDDIHLGEFTAEVEEASVAVVDLGGDPEIGVRLCAALRARQPDLRLLAVVCCARPTLAWHVQELITHGVNEVLDTQTAPADFLAALHGNDAARTRVRLHQKYGGVATALDSLSGDQRWLLERIACGWMDAALAAALHVSARTVRSRLERLKDELAVSSREELAAWAGAHGLYQPPAPAPFGD